MNNEQQLIWDYLVQNALGKVNAKAISDIANAIGVPPKGTNNDDVLTSMICDDFRLLSITMIWITYAPSFRTR